VARYPLKFCSLLAADDKSGRQFRMSSDIIVQSLVGGWHKQRATRVWNNGDHHRRTTPISAGLIDRQSARLVHPKFDARPVYQANVKIRLFILQELRTEGSHERTPEANETKGQEITPTAFGKAQG